MSSACEVQQRYVLTTMLFLSLVVTVAVRSNIGIALTQIVKIPNLIVTANNDSSIVHEEICPADDILNEHDDGSGNSTEIIANINNDERYNWSQKQQGVVLASFYWGYIISQIPSGMLATRYGGKYMLGMGIMISAILSLLTPLAIRLGGAIALIILRVLMGLAQGAVFPALSSMVAAWVPLSERGRLCSFIHTGPAFGNIFATYLSAVIIHYTKSWPIVFYIFGAVVIVWCVIFLFICYNSPDSHPFITEVEKNYIHAEMKNGKDSPEKQKHTPWMAILTSTPVIALTFATVLNNFGYYLITTDLTKYINDVLHISVLKNGVYSSMPNIAAVFISLAAGWLCDWMIVKKRYTVTFTRKLFVVLGAVLPAIFIVLASYAGCDKLLVIGCLIFSVGCMGFNAAGTVLNMLDLSPNYAGTLAGLTNCIGSLTGVLAPFAIGLMTPNALLTEWRLVFWIMALVQILKAVIFTVWGSAEVQSWNSPVESKNA